MNNPLTIPEIMASIRVAGSSLLMEEERQRCSGGTLYPYPVCLEPDFRPMSGAARAKRPGPRRDDEPRDDLECRRLLLTNDVMPTAGKLEDVLRGLHAGKGIWSFEAIGMEGRVRFQFIVRPERLVHLETSIKSQLPGSILQKCEDPVAAFVRTHASALGSSNGR